MVEQTPLLILVMRLAILTLLMMKVLLLDLVILLMVLLQKHMVSVKVTKQL